MERRYLTHATTVALSGPPPAPREGPPAGGSDVAERARLRERVVCAFAERNRVSAVFFPRESHAIATACGEMAARFAAGGRLLAFGRGARATDAQHVSVEFMHPVIAGCHALPAIDLSQSFDARLDALLRPGDIVMGFGPPHEDAAINDVLARARACGAQTFGLDGGPADFALGAPSPDPFIHQEIGEIVYHALWESVHVYLERSAHRQPAGALAFAIPQARGTSPGMPDLADEVAALIEDKAKDDERLRERCVETQATAIAETVMAIRSRIDAGGKLILFGNGGSATDANDWAIDAAEPGDGRGPVAAVSLSMEPALNSAIANDDGVDAMFLHQLITHGRREDVAIAISTSGDSANLRVALQEARARGLLTVALLGYDGGEIQRRGLADRTLVVPSDSLPRIQEVHASIYHVMCDLLAENR